MKEFTGFTALKGIMKIFIPIFDSKQDNIRGQTNQIVGFDNARNAVPIDEIPATTGVISYNGRKGRVVPTAGDYNPSMVGADPAGSAAAVKKELTDTHVNNFNNPHRVTAVQVGALPITGGTLTGPLTIGRMRISWNESEQSIDVEVI